MCLLLCLDDEYCLFFWYCFMNGRHQQMSWNWSKCRKSSSANGRMQKAAGCTTSNALRSWRNSTKEWQFIFFVSILLSFLLHGSNSFIFLCVQDLTELQKERQCLEKQHQQEANKLNQELQQAMKLHNALQAQLDKVNTHTHASNQTSEQSHGATTYRFEFCVNSMVTADAVSTPVSMIFPVLSAFSCFLYFIPLFFSLSSHCCCFCYLCQRPINESVSSPVPLSLDLLILFFSALHDSNPLPCSSLLLSSSLRSVSPRRKGWAAKVMPLWLRSEHEFKLTVCGETVRFLNQLKSNSWEGKGDWCQFTQHP